jgi:hypothetical protein
MHIIGGGMFFRDQGYKTMMITPDSNVRSTINCDGGVLLNLSTGVVFRINAVGATVWQMIEQGTAIEKILDSLVNQYTIPRDQAEKDTREFLQQLKIKRLIQDSGF